MADRNVVNTATLDTLRTTYNSTAADVGDIASVTGASGVIGAATDIIEAITSAASGSTITFAIDSTVATLVGSQTFTNKTFTSPTINELTFASGQSTSGLNIGANGIIFEGATADAHETTLTAADPTADHTITIPDSSITLLTTATHVNKSIHIARCIALG